MVYVTSGLLEVLLDLAADADPEQLTASMAVSPGRDLEGPDAEELHPETQVFTDFYLPDTGGSVTAVFGVDLSTPAGQTQGRFVSHPKGELEVSRTDDLHEVVFVTVPPWDRDSVGVFDRSGRRRELRILEAYPPDEPFAES